MGVNVAELLQQLADAVETAKAKGVKVEETKAYFEAASADYQDAQAVVEQLRQSVNDTIGELLPASRARVR